MSAYYIIIESLIDYLMKKKKNEERKPPAVSFSLSYTAVQEISRPPSAVVTMATTRGKSIFPPSISLSC